MATLGIFVKQPVAGQVKTRLGAEIGEQRAAEIYEAFLTEIFEATLPLKLPRAIAYSPDGNTARDYFTAFATAGDCLWAQPETSLGGRLTAFFQTFLTDDEPVVVIGSDSPSLPMDYVQEAFKKLADVDVVLGPAMDGGYYLIGMRRSLPSLFEQIDWSCSSVLDQTFERLKTTGATLHLLPPWYDVDTLEDLRFLRSHLKAMQASDQRRPDAIQLWQRLESLPF